MYLMNHRTLPKLIFFQDSFTFLDDDASSARKDPLVPLLETNAAVAFCDRSEFRDLDAEFKGSAVTVSFIILEPFRGF